MRYAVEKEAAGVNLTNSTNCIHLLPKWECMSIVFAQDSRL